MLGISQPTDAVPACYECHEVVLHNPVLNREQLERLMPHFEGKDFAGKAIAFNKILEAGLNSFEQ